MRSRAFLIPAWLLAGAATVALLALVARVRPGGPPTCLMLLATGLDCPGCGMTRAMGSLLRGELGPSLRMHPLAPLFLLQAVVAWGWWGLVLARRARKPDPWWLAGLVGFDCVALVATWLARLATGTLP